MTSSPRELPPEGLTVGGYRLLARLGEGGMGVVHLGQRPGGDRVALKVLRPHVVGDDEARARLAREVNSLTRIRSRRVAEIVDADPWGEIPYVATRYVPGLSLHDHVREEGAITGSDLTWLAACLAEALAAVHDVGVLHRDVKPSNVLMEGRTPILIDFGLARLADDPRLTHTGWLLGTPGYLAPEILYGEDATAASDVHSWAATVAFAGTGRPPFGRGPGMAIMDRVRRGEHDLSGLDPDLLGPITEALDPDPSRRPGLGELQQWLDSRLGDELDDSFAHHTVPLAVASLSVVEDPTERAEHTDILPFDEPDHWYDEPHDRRYDDPGTRVGAAERSRRVVLLAAGAGAATLGIAAAPYLALGLLVVLSWLLRSGSLAGSAASQRRQLRGVKWYDAPQLLVAAPWHLVASIPGTLLLVLWSAGLGAAAALLCFAAALSFGTSLAVVGLSFVLALWWGPGGERLRSPVGRVARPLSRRPLAWFVATALVVAVVGGLASLASSGTSWAPADGRPFSGVGIPDGGILGR